MHFEIISSGVIEPSLENIFSSVNSASHTLLAVELNPHLQTQSYQLNSVCQQSCQFHLRHIQDTSIHGRVLKVQNILSTLLVPWNRSRLGTAPLSVTMCQRSMITNLIRWNSTCYLFLACLDLDSTNVLFNSIARKGVFLQFINKQWLRIGLYSGKISGITL